MDDEDLNTRALRVIQGGVISFTWTRSALCAQIPMAEDEFFPEPGRTPATARRMCSMCPVQAECLAEAILNDEQWGIWGGLSRRERNAWGDLMGVSA